MEELRVYEVAHSYASRFNDLLKVNGWNVKISFPKPDLVKVGGLTICSLISSDYFKMGDYIYAEKYLKG